MIELDHPASRKEIEMKVSTNRRSLSRVIRQLLKHNEIKKIMNEMSSIPLYEVEKK